MLSIKKCSNSYSVAQLLHSDMAHGTVIKDNITERSYPLHFSQLKLVQAKTRKTKNLWNKITAKYHYLGYTGTVGRYIRYFICDYSSFAFLSKNEEVEEYFHEFINNYTHKEIDEILGLEKSDSKENHDIEYLPKSHLGVYLRFGWWFGKNQEKAETKETKELFSSILGCISAGSATYSCKQRDILLGINHLPRRDRDKYLQYIANNWRFLLLGKWPNLASHILSKFSKKVQKDWTVKYNSPLIAIESFVMKDRFEGSSYIANRWLNVGETKGYSKSGSISNDSLSVYGHGEKKDIYLKLNFRFPVNGDPILYKIKKRNEFIMQKICEGYSLDKIVNILKKSEK